MFEESIIEPNKANLTYIVLCLIRFWLDIWLQVTKQDVTRSTCQSYIRKGKYRPAPAAPVYVTLRLPPLDSEMGCTGELCSKTKLLILEN